MTRGNNHPGRPHPSHLAAYLDGGLGPYDRARVEAWLAAHPEDAAELAAHRRLARLWNETAPDGPDEVTWARVLGRVEGTLARQAPTRPRPPRPRAWKGAAWAWAGALLAGSAAAVALAFFTPPPPEPQPWPVASADDVDIVSLDFGDYGALVVGVPPLRGPIQLASAEDVVVAETGHDVEVVRPDEGQPGAKWMVVPSDPSGKE
jgi:hypothetical protein